MDFADRERLNAQIDVWIDEEEYDKVIFYLKLSDRAKALLTEMFEHDSCTAKKDDKWAEALGLDGQVKPLPVANHLRARDLRDGKLYRLDRDWSRLFWAKLLRAKIKEKGTDCYFRRLDDLLSYLEVNLPRPRPGNTDDAKLTVIYLLELSAIALPSEQYGFADRAQRMMRGDVLGGENGDDTRHFCRFYDLLARYDMGVALFHQAQYRNAVLEFNWIIYEVRRLRRPRVSGGDAGELQYFRERFGDDLLFLPSVMYRADVQLKLQLGYHALDTMLGNRELFSQKPCYKSVRSELIQAEACQQSGLLDDSWLHLQEAFKGISRLKGAQEYPADQDTFTIPPYDPGKGFSTIAARALDLLVEDCLNQLEASSLLKASSLPTRLVRCSREVSNAFSGPRWQVSRYNAEGRQGFYQQLAKYLKWSLGEDHAEDIKGLAIDTYEIHKRGLLEPEGAEPGEEDAGEHNTHCQYCTPQGIDLRRLRPYHYRSFTDDMLKVLCKLRSGQHSLETHPSAKGEVEEEREGFVTRLVKLERVNRDDLRFRNLELRYESKKVTDRLNKGIGVCSQICFGERRETAHKAFEGLLTECPGLSECPDRKVATKAYDLDKADYEHILMQWDQTFFSQLSARSQHDLQRCGTYFLGLQRWNSSSPAKGRSVGGGYLLYHTDCHGKVDLGIAVDPGFDFLRNLFHLGFSLHDIDIVLISHAHVDHIRDFESIALLLLELKNRAQQTRRVHVVLSLGSYRRLKHIFEDPDLRYFVEPYIIDINKEIDRDYWEDLQKSPGFKFVNEPLATDQKHQLTDYRAIIRSAGDGGHAACYPMVTIQPTRAYHNDFSGFSDSFGFLMTIQGSKESTTVFGYSGDTKWVYDDVADVPFKGRDNHERKVDDIATQYAGCDTVLLHLGSLIDKNRKGEYEFGIYRPPASAAEKNECEKLVRKKNHPYLIGILRLSSSLDGISSSGKRPLILLSEFGEELRGGIRRDLVERLKGGFGDEKGGGLSFLPVDVGVTVKLSDHPDGGGSKRPEAWCIQCNQFVKTEAAQFETYGSDEAMFCVCETCHKATPRDVLQDRLRRLYEEGYEFRAAI